MTRPSLAAFLPFRKEPLLPPVLALLVSDFGLLAEPEVLLGEDCVLGWEPGSG